MEEIISVSFMGLIRDCLASISDDCLSKANKVKIEITHINLFLTIFLAGLLSCAENSSTYTNSILVQELAINMDTCGVDSIFQIETFYFRIKTL